MIVLHWDRMKRPDRSGFLGALLALEFLVSLVFVTGGVGGDLCFWPRECRTVEAKNDFHVIPITYGAGKGGQKCGCHIDHRERDHDIWLETETGAKQIYQNGWWYEHEVRWSLTCDSEIFDWLQNEGLTERNVWYRPIFHSYNIGDITRVPDSEGTTRFHCGTDWTGE